MTTQDLKTTIGSIQDILSQLQSCANDSEIDENHTVTDHYDCVDDLKDIAKLIKKAVK